MKLLLVFIAICFFKVNSHAITADSCELPVFSLGAAQPSPLQSQAEAILLLRGFKIVPHTADEFKSANLSDFPMYATTNAGQALMENPVDCIEREFEDLGKFYTCHFEMTLYFYSKSEMAYVPAFEIKAATRDARSTEAFYQTVNDQLRNLPTCLDLKK